MLIIFLLFNNFLYIITKEKNLVVIPFSLRKINYFSNYNSTYFLNDYIFNNILLNLNIGTPIQNVSSKIELNTNCFLMQINNSDNPYDTNLYSPRFSSSIIKRTSKLFKEALSFNNHNESYLIDFQIPNLDSKANFSDYDYISVIGLDIPQTEGNCPNFFKSLKKQNLIDKFIWTIEYINDNEGNLVIGEDLSVYNSNKYSQDNYYTTYTFLTYLLQFDSVYINDKYSENKDNNFYYINMTQSTIATNYGLIIGPHAYKILIDKLFFNDLIENNICKCDIVRYEYNKKSHAGLDYFVYSCDDKQFTDKNNDYFNKFPELIFSLKNLEHNFIFTNKDLFKHINDKYYFLVLFQTNYDVKEIVWYLGEPFFKPYTLSLNFDAKTIGFYFKIESEHKNDEDNRNKKLIFIISIIAEVIVAIGLIIFIIILVKKIREKRKNRLNEIPDDNYDYNPENSNKKIEPMIN